MSHVQPGSIGSEPLDLSNDRMRIENHSVVVMQDHRVRGVSVLPGSMLLAMLHTRWGRTVTKFSNLTFESMIPIPEGSEIELSVMPEPSGELVLSDVSGRMRYASMTVDRSAIDPSRSIPNHAEDDSTPLTTDGSSLYAGLATKGNDYGPLFRGISALSTNAQSGHATWKSTSDMLDSECRMAVLIDACAHLSAALGQPPSTFLLKSIGQIEIAGVEPPKIANLSATLIASDQTSSRATVEVFLPNGDFFARITDLQLHHLERVVIGGQQAARHVAVTGTFTLDPLQQFGAFLNNTLSIDLDFRLADYGQVFQELLGNGKALDNDAAAHAVLLRLEDWAQHKSRTAGANVSSGQESFGELNTYKLASGKTVAHLNEYETRYLDKEINNDLAYRRHAIGLIEGDVVVDIGANIGLFSLFAYDQAANIKVIAIEPSPYVLPMLRANLAVHAPGSVVVPAGAARSKGQAQFTAYPKSSVFSTFASDKPADLDALAAIVRNTLKAAGHLNEAFVEETIEQMLSDRMEQETYQVDLVSVSDLIREHHLKQIGLLKIDAEKSEHAILEGIEDEHWPLIEQLVVEVHTQDGSSEQAVSDTLARHGFEIVRDEEKLLSGSGLITLYAARPERRQQVQAEQAALLSESVDMYVSAAQTHSATSKQPLLTVLCPTTSNDPLLRELVGDAQEDLLTRLQALSNSVAVDWNTFAKRYRVGQIANSVGDELGHIPYSQRWYAATATALLRHEHARLRPPFKVIALDCDNTLWNGIVGEQGPGGIEFEPGHLNLLSFVKERLAEGMVACLVSKNNLDDVREVFEAHPELPLKWDDFVAHRINWSSKSSNLIDIAAELNLGLDSFVFLDDSSLECAQVRAACPELLALQMPTQADGFAAYLDQIWAFDNFANTAEDKVRTERYRDEARRNRYRQSASSLSEFLNGLQLTVEIRDVKTDAELDRVAQMTKRTNQFNLTTKRRTVNEISEIIAVGQTCWLVQVSDRFGDYGITGAVIFEETDSAIEVDTLLLSCRVLGRGVEHRVLAKLGQTAMAHGRQELILPFEPTAKNAPAKLFLDSLSDAIPLGVDSTARRLAAESAAQTVYMPEVRTATEKEDASGHGGTTEDSSQTGVAGSAVFDSAALQALSQVPDIVAFLVEQAAVSAKRPRPELPITFVQPGNETEKQLASIWTKILGLNEVGIDDSFFDLGGTSLKAVEMVVALHEQLQLKSRVAVVDVFDMPTIRALSQVIEGTGSQHRVQASKERGAARRQRLAPRPSKRR